MTLKEATAQVKDLSARHEGKLNATVKLELTEGIIFLDDTVSPGIISNENREAQCTIKISMQNLSKLISGDLNPMMAFIGGKMKIEGDKSIAMRLSSIF